MDPWLQDGDVHPALKAAGMPEWTSDADEDCRLAVGRDAENVWWMVQCNGDDGLEEQYTTPYEAHAIIEKWLREWLLERGWKVMWSFRRQVYVIFERVSGQGYFREDLGSFETEPAALQAAALAAKEREP